MDVLAPFVVATVKATAPLLARHGQQVIGRMYERLFAANPELKALFNPAHLTPNGQIGALAEALTAYAGHIDHLDKFAPTVERIAQKHVALLIRPEQYPIVGHHLLDALREVLGGAATPQVMDAWTAAYQHLADLFVAREKGLYDRHGQESGGWTGLRDFEVVRKVPESETITSFYLAPTDGRPLAAFRPGQYLALHFGELAPAGAWRTYSLSDRPQPDHFRISVKREPKSRFGSAGVVSNHLHDSVKAGDTVRLGQPAGDFFLPEGLSRPIVLLSGGIGVAPLLSMLSHLSFHGHPAPVYFIHATDHRRVHAFRGEVIELCARRPQFIQHVRYSRPDAASCVSGRDYDSVGLVNFTLVASLVRLPFKAEYFLCGPQPFMRALYGGLIAGGVPGRQIHFEFFGPHASVTSVGGRR